ncbi:hypothetical protein HHK36_015472 [Tetracentron sinense]|uniref:Uncharacterized protein n=1 Tax=Tetracentron sinense TaxID=13715 RepID=A0A835DCV2_TETSI|nr:hypothetical protein HHK36_015472 [Tetracentron sinense]
MADTAISMQKLKMFWDSQVHDEEKWSLNKSNRLQKIRGSGSEMGRIIIAASAVHVKLLRAAGLFAGSILLMRNFGDLMAI